MDFETSKILCAVASLMFLIGSLPFVSGYTIFMLPIVALILFLIGIKGLADNYNERRIFSNALYGTIIGITGVASAFGLIFFAFIQSFELLFPGWNADWAYFSQLDPAELLEILDLTVIGSFVAVILVAIVILFVSVLILAILYRKSFNLLHEKSGVELFGTAGTILVIGAVLTVLLVGLILIWVSFLILTIAFFQLKAPSSENIFQT